MFTFCFNNEFICVFFTPVMFWRTPQKNFPVRDNTLLLYCIVLHFITGQNKSELDYLSSIIELYSSW